MKRRYADGGDVFREGRDFPTNTEDMKSAPAPLTDTQRKGKMNIGKASDLTPAERRKIMRDMPMEPVKRAKGGYVKSADGCCQRGKTRGKMV